MKPIWEIYQAEDVSDTGQKIWLLDGPMVKGPLMFPSLKELHRYMESFHETPKPDRTVTKMRSGDASTPKHPYDRPDSFWEDEVTDGTK